MPCSPSRIRRRLLRAHATRFTAVRISALQYLNRVGAHEDQIEKVLNMPIPHYEPIVEIPNNVGRLPSSNQRKRRTRLRNRLSH